MQILKFKDMDEVINRANNTIYGLAAGVFTKDINKMNTITSSVRAGTVWWVKVKRIVINEADAQYVLYRGRAALQLS